MAPPPRPASADVGVRKAQRRRIPRLLGRAEPLVRPRLANKSLAHLESLLLDDGGTRVSITLSTQQAENWCWAAVIQAVLAQRGTAQSQGAIVARHTGHDCPPTAPPDISPTDCTTSHCPNPCNGPHSMRAALAAIPLASTPLAVADGALAAITSDFAAGKPVIARIADDAGNGHFMLLTGHVRHFGSDFIRYRTPYVRTGEPVPVEEAQCEWSALLGGFSHRYAIRKATHFYRL